MTDNIKKNWEPDLVDCPSNTVPQLVAVLNGGESITLKSMASSQSVHYIGKNKDMVAARSYPLAAGETMTLTLPVTFGRHSFIEIWALPTDAGADIAYFKLFGNFPSTEAGV